MRRRPPVASAADTTAALYAALRKRYPTAGGEWGLLFDVGNKTGFDVKARADAVAMSLWPSGGLAIHGFEVKSTRDDWLREKRNPAKAEAMSRLCDRWWIVVASDDVVQDGELPDTWGLLVLRKGKLATAKDAPLRPGVEVSRDFFAAVFRAAHKVSSAEEVKALADLKFAERLTAAEERWQRDNGNEVGRLKRDLERESTDRLAFERASGVSLVYAGERVGKAVKLAMAMDSPRQELERMERALRAQADAVARTLKETQPAQPLTYAEAPPAAVRP